MEFAEVKAGHDRSQIYMIAAEMGSYVYLVNGTTKPLTHPKKKNKKHIQVIKKLPQEILEIMESSGDENHKVKKAIKMIDNSRRMKQHV